MEAIDEDREYVLQQTIGFQRMIQRAINHARSAEKNGGESGGYPGLDFSGKRLPCRLLSGGRRHHPPGCAQLHLPQYGPRAKIPGSRT